MLLIKQKQIDRNRERDRQNTYLLRTNGWQVITLWACSLSKDQLENTMLQVSVALNENYLRIAKEK